ncbi:hypothetical protein EV126DRAFT_191420 [Verticillium dahliae]|nr:hypothetical protein EV126DRAFT_191420 [Verticillium dahliae]
MESNNPRSRETTSAMSRVCSARLPPILRATWVHVEPCLLRSALLTYPSILHSSLYFSVSLFTLAFSLSHLSSLTLSRAFSEFNPSSPPPASSLQPPAFCFSPATKPPRPPLTAVFTAAFVPKSAPPEPATPAFSNPYPAPSHCIPPPPPWSIMAFFSPPPLRPLASPGNHSRRPSERTKVSAGSASRGPSLVDSLVPNPV